MKHIHRTSSPTLTLFYDLPPVLSHFRLFCFVLSFCCKSRSPFLSSLLHLLLCWFSEFCFLFSHSRVYPQTYYPDHFRGSYNTLRPTPNLCLVFNRELDRREPKEEAGTIATLNFEHPRKVLRISCLQRTISTSKVETAFLLCTVYKEMMLKQYFYL